MNAISQVQPPYLLNSKIHNIYSGQYSTYAYLFCRTRSFEKKIYSYSQRRLQFSIVRGPQFLT